MLIRSSILISFFTLISRMLGYAREILMATVLGAGPIANAFHVAFRFANVFRSFFAEGAFTSSFVPIFTKKLNNEGIEKASFYASQTFSMLILALIALSVIAEWQMDKIMTVLAPGFNNEPELFNLAVTFARITFPYLFFMSLSALFGGMLSSVGKYSSIAISPIILNLCMMVALVIKSDDKEYIGKLLSLSIVVSGCFQLVLVLYIAIKNKLFVKLVKPSLNSDTRKFLKTMIPGVLSASVVQINLWVSTSIATLFEKAVSLMYYSDRIVQLPLALIGTSISMVLLPVLSKYQLTDSSKTNDIKNRTIEITMLLTLPTVIIIIALAEPIIVSTFEYGAFTKEDSQATANLMIIMTLALPAYILNKIFTPCFYSIHDTKTPFKVALMSLLLNIAVNMLFLGFHKTYLGIAIASTISSWFNVTLLYCYLKRFDLIKFDKRLKRKLLANLFACLILIAIMFLIIKINIALPTLILTLIKVGIAYSAFIIIAFLFKAYDFTEIKGILIYRKK
ncbi:MAG: murein biosynthesis integral membrane protein MurJ [Sphingobacteriia bacterium]|nr:murein biosynthesis integral membrane protein MurJ [Sphingobacteriia bacterium]